MFPLRMYVRIPFRRLVASLLVVAYATIAALGGALVRCQEADGSVGVEWRGSGCCLPSLPIGSEAPAAAATASIEDVDCEGCSDEALTDTLASARTRGSAPGSVKAPDVPALPPVLFVAAGPVFFDSATHWSRQLRAPLPPPQLAAIRTVVLHC